MALAGYCAVCKQHVYLNDQWGCVNGHGWDQISAWYDPETGAPVTPYWLEPGYAAPAASVPEQPEPQPKSSRESLLAAIREAFSAYLNYRVEYGTNTDIVLDNQGANASWGTGKKKIEYSAILKAVEADRTVYFWEVLKESGAGLSFGGFEGESYSTFGTKRSGKKKEVVLGPNGVEINADWDYSATRKIVESIAQAQGWRVKTVLRKGAAEY
jgi:hypothetical protein